MKPLAVQPVETMVWRVGFAPDPWAWAGWEYAQYGRFDGRWDDPNGTWRTLYVGDTLLACLLEVLAHFRRDNAMAAELAEISVDPDDATTFPTAAAGTVSPAWFGPRRAGSAWLRGDFIDLTTAPAIAALYGRFAGAARDHGFADFDSSTLKDGRARELTQKISSWIYDQTNADGVRFASRHGDELALWAIYERPRGGARGPCITQIFQVQFGPHHQDVIEASRLLGIKWTDA